MHRPIISWDIAWPKTATERASDIWRNARTSYVAPPLDPGIAEAIDEYVRQRKQDIARAC